MAQNAPFQIFHEILVLIGKQESLEAVENGKLHLSYLRLLNEVHIVPLSRHKVFY